MQSPSCFLNVGLPFFSLTAEEGIAEKEWQQQLDNSSFLGSSSSLRLTVLSCCRCFAIKRETRTLAFMSLCSEWDGSYVCVGEIRSSSHSAVGLLGVHRKKEEKTSRQAGSQTYCLSVFSFSVEGGIWGRIWRVKSKQANPEGWQASRKTTFLFVILVIEFPLARLVYYVESNKKRNGANCLLVCSIFPVFSLPSSD